MRRAELKAKRRDTDAGYARLLAKLQVVAAAVQDQERGWRALGPEGWRERRSPACPFHPQQYCPRLAGDGPENFRRPGRVPPPDYIAVPPWIRAWELSRFVISSRLRHVLGEMGCRVLGDLHGRRMSQMLRWRNFGKKSAAEVVVLLLRIHEGRWDLCCGPTAFGPEDYYEI